MGAAIRKNQGVGSPGVGLAHVKRVGGVGAQLPGWLQVVQLVVLVDCSGGVRVVVSQTLVDVAIMHDGLRGVRAVCRGYTAGGAPWQAVPLQPYAPLRLCALLRRPERGGSTLATKGREWGYDLSPQLG